MPGGIDSLNDDWGDGAVSWRVPWLVRLALAWMAGLVIGSALPGRWGYVIAGAVAVGLGLVLWRRGRLGAARWAALFAIACIGSAWLVVHRDDVDGRHVLGWVAEDSVLAVVRGTVASEPRDVEPDQGPFGGFNYLGPGTMFELRVSAIDAGDGFEPAHGGLLVRVKRHEHRPKVGQRIEAKGWLSAIGPTQNPGEFDYRAFMREQGVVGRLSMQERGNWRALGPAPQWTLTGVRRSIGDAAAWSLRLGMPDDAEMMGLLDALLLGRRAGGIDDLSDSFRAVGLSHILSISGAHLAILLLLVWGLGRLLIGRPRLVVLLVAAVLVLFMLAVPWRTPIVRAAIMAGVFCVGYGLGRRLTGLEMLSAAALIVLVWKPTDLFNAGFQLSFGVVGGILLFAGPMSQRLLSKPDATVVQPSAWDVGVRWLVDVVAVSVVAFLVALPLVMYHFQLVSPLAVLLSVLALPVLTGVLAMGYLKILVGLVSPAVGSLLAVPTAWVSDTLSGLVVQAQRWPGASVSLSAGPSVAWTLAASGVVLALLAWVTGAAKARGRRAGRWRLLLVSAAVLVVGWSVLEQRPSGAMTGADRPAMVVNMLAVGDGSCFVVRSGDRAVMFDCGSQAYWRIGERSVVPALAELGVRRLDVLMISHADLDHFMGVLDVVDAVAVDRVLVSPDVMREARDNPGRAADFLVDSLRERGIEPGVIERGWSMTMGDASLAVLWPASEYASEQNNNNSLVLRVQAAGRVVLLNGDIQGEAIERLLENPHQLKADVTDLAHHGSYVDQSPRWLEAVDPVWVLQSSGPRRPEQDRWRIPLAEQGIERLWTRERGMIQVRVEQDGAMSWSSHRGGEAD